MSDTITIVPESKYSKVAEKKEIDNVIKALKANGISAVLVESKEEAKKKILEMIPKGSEVFTMPSVTLDSSGISSEINGSKDYISVKNKLYSKNKDQANDKDDEMEMKRHGAAPEYALGSVHAVTENGEVIIASATGSQLPAYAYGAKKVIWIVGAQKIVKNIDEGMKRIYEHTLKLESERAKKAYGVPGSFVAKLLIINKEFTPERLSMVIINESLGF